MPGATYTLGFMQRTNGNMRVRVYDSPDKGVTFAYQWDIPLADWNAILLAVGTGTGGAQVPAAGVENFTANYGKLAGQVGVQEAIS